MAILKDNFFIDPIDFSAYFNAGKNIFISPDKVYNIPHPSYYYYLPNIATIFSIFTLFEFYFSAWIYYFFLIIFGLLFIIEFNKILILKNVNNVFLRFLFLMILINGQRLSNEFDLLNVKIIIAYLLVLFIRREISRQPIENDNINFKFLSIQFIILNFIISMVPPFIFIIFIYLFHQVDIKHIFNRIQLKKYLLFLLIFVLQNFMFLVYPSLFLHFLDGLRHVKVTTDPLYILTPDYISTIEFKPPINPLLIIGMFLGIETFYIIVLSICSMIIITIFISFKQNTKIEDKFGYFFLFSFFLSSYVKMTHFMFIAPLIALIFIRNPKTIEDLEDFSNLRQFIKRNYLLLIGLFCVFLLVFTPPLFYLYRVFSFLKYMPVIIMLFSWTYLFIIIIFVFYFHNRKYQ